MNKKLYKLTCNRNDAEELINHFADKKDIEIKISDEHKNLEGLSEIVSLIVGVTSISANALSIWVNIKKSKNKKVELEELDSNN